MSKLKRKVIPYWWLSFVDETGFLGVNILRGRNRIEAIMISHRLGINPGGAIAAHQFPENAPTPPAEVVNRLLSREDLNRLVPEWNCISAREAKEKGLLK